jgi:hypothetical protein
MLAGCQILVPRNEGETRLTCAPATPSAAAWIGVVPCGAIVKSSTPRADLTIAPHGTLEECSDGRWSDVLRPLELAHSATPPAAVSERNGARSDSPR